MQRDARAIALLSTLMALPVQSGVAFHRGSAFDGPAARRIHETTMAPATCEPRNDDAVTAERWTEVRVALMAVDSTQRDRRGTVRAIQYERVIDPPTGIVLHQSTSSQTTMTARTARTPTELASLGYLADNAGQPVLAGLGLSALIDAAFPAGHCFRTVAADPKRPGEVGLAFVPAQERQNIVDVAGIIWLDLATRSPRTIEYRYTNIAPSSTGGALGGSATFRPLGGGRTIMSSWMIRTSPFNHMSLSAATAADANLSHLADGVATSESGAELLSAAWPDANGHAATDSRASNGVPPLGRVVGVARSADRKTPVANLTVRLAGTGYGAVTDAQGAYAFDNVLPGRYSIAAVDDSLLAFTNDGIGEDTVDVKRQATATANLTWRSVTQVIDAQCGVQEIGSVRLLVRLVQDPTALPSSRAAGVLQLQIEWELSGRTIRSTIGLYKFSPYQPDLFFACSIGAAAEYSTLIAHINDQIIRRTWRGDPGVPVDTVTLVFPGAAGG